MFDLFGTLYNVDVLPDRRVAEIAEEAKGKVAKYFGIPKYSLTSKIRIAQLPEIYEVEIRRVGGYIVRGVRKIGKVLGMFNGNTDEIYLAPENLYDKNSLKEKLIHEFTHNAQKVLGKIYRLPRYMLEREAYAVQHLLS